MIWLGRIFFFGGGGGGGGGEGGGGGGLKFCHLLFDRTSEQSKGFTQNFHITTAKEQGLIYP